VTDPTGAPPETEGGPASAGAPVSSFWSLFQGRAKPARDLTLHLSAREGKGLVDKARQAYYWIVNNAVIVPYYDIEFSEGEPAKLAFRTGDELRLPSAASWSSYVLLPLLAFLTCRRALLVGGPGRGKTATALLMGLLAGYSEREMKRAVQHGHPQLTIGDLLGTALPSDLMKAEALEEIRVSWARWLTMRVKIIDEYNRIPTKTQSALLSLMAEGYAELLGQIVETKNSAWFLTANDDEGGGTFQVIEALKDRIDLTVRAMTFNSRFLEKLLERLERDRDPLDLVPRDIVFAAEELDAAHAEIRALPYEPRALRLLEHFVGSLDFCLRGGRDFEHKSKDSLRLAGIPLARVCNEECPLDKMRHVCAQTTAGLSARSFLTVLEMAKALAWFRGRPAVGVDDVRQILPYCLHEKLRPHASGDFFQAAENRVLLSDKVAWIRRMFDMTVARFDEEGRGKSDAGRDLALELEAGLEGVPAPEARRRLDRVRAELERLARGAELNASVYEDAIRLKYVHMRYQNYLHWLERGAGA
jgi:MoxR-like ATPase